jgi:hypothetical protein
VPITIRHEGDVAQMLGLNYLGALGQFRQKQQSRQAQLALSYAKMRANQQSQMFQADQNRQMAEFDASQKWSMAQARELAAQGRAREARQLAVDDRRNERSFLVNQQRGVQRHQVAMQDDRQEEARAAEVLGDAGVRVNNWPLHQKNTLPPELAEVYGAINNGQVNMPPDMQEKWDDYNTKMNEALVEEKWDDNAKDAEATHWWGKMQGIMGQVDKGMMPSLEDQVRDRNPIIDGDRYETNDAGGLDLAPPALQPKPSQEETDTKARVTKIVTDQSYTLPGEEHPTNPSIETARLIDLADQGKWDELDEEQQATVLDHREKRKADGRRIRHKEAQEKIATAWAARIKQYDEETNTMLKSGKLHKPEEYLSKRQLDRDRLGAGPDGTRSLAGIVEELTKQGMIPTESMKELAQDDAEGREAPPETAPPETAPPEDDQPGAVSLSEMSLDELNQQVELHEDKKKQIEEYKDNINKLKEQLEIISEKGNAEDMQPILDMLEVETEEEARQLIEEQEDYFDRKTEETTEFEKELNAARNRAKAGTEIPKGPIFGTKKDGAKIELIQGNISRWPSPANRSQLSRQIAVIKRMEFPGVPKDKNLVPGFLRAMEVDPAVIKKLETLLAFAKYGLDENLPPNAPDAPFGPPEFRTAWPAFPTP